MRKQVDNSDIDKVQKIEGWGIGSNFRVQKRGRSKTLQRLQAIEQHLLEGPYLALLSSDGECSIISGPFEILFEAMQG